MADPKGLIIILFALLLKYSNWAADGKMDGSIDNLRIYRRALSAADVQRLHCQGRPAYDCQGLLAHFDFEGSATDASGAGWFGHVVRARQYEDIFTATGVSKDGSQALQLLGKDAYITLEPRTLGGPMSFCADVKYTDVASWSRIIDFANGAGSDVRREWRSEMWD